ncbi:MAG: hypothetical protein ACI9J5_000727, partial [Paraglaciecola sp.]
MQYYIRTVKYPLDLLGFSMGNPYNPREFLIIYFVIGDLIW